LLDIIKAFPKQPSSSSYGTAKEIDTVKGIESQQVAFWHQYRIHIVTKPITMNITSTNSETILIQDCINGNRKSQKELYDRFSSKLFHICLRYAKNQMDAEDILQEGFIKLFNSLSKFRGEGSFEGWVRRIFVNTAIEHLRRKQLTTSEVEGIENLVVAKSSNGLDNLYEKDLMTITGTLSEGYRTVFQYYAVEGYSHKEIGQKLGISESTSKSQFSRAKAILRNRLEHKSSRKDLRVAV
jgi:RNA polymerase sigma-70 factor (ECF subfamily)